MGIDSTVGCNVTVGLGGIGVLVNTISVVGVGVEIGFGVEDGAERQPTVSYLLSISRIFLLCQFHP
ncbi:MAG: hypothetical protein ABFD53_03990, partial [Anaerolineaceae bacterium]